MSRKASGRGVPDGRVPFEIAASRASGGAVTQIVHRSRAARGRAAIVVPVHIEGDRRGRALVDAGDQLEHSRAPAVGDLSVVGINATEADLGAHLAVDAHPVAMRAGAGASWRQPFEGNGRAAVPCVKGEGLPCGAGPADRLVLDERIALCGRQARIDAATVVCAEQAHRRRHLSAHPVARGVVKGCEARGIAVRRAASVACEAWAVAHVEERREERGGRSKRGLHEESAGEARGGDVRVAAGGVPVNPISASQCGRGQVDRACLIRVI